MRISLLPLNIKQGNLLSLIGMKAKNAGIIKMSMGKG